MEKVLKKWFFVSKKFDSFVREEKGFLEESGKVKFNNKDNVVKF